MEKIFKNNNDGTLLVSIAYSAEDYTPVMNKVALKLAEDVTIKGFRKGKAPLDKAIQYIKNEDLYQGMVRKLIDRDFPGLLEDYEEAKTVSAIQPSLNIDYSEEKKVYTFEYTFVYLPTCELGKYKGLKIEVKPQEVTQEEIDAKIEGFRKEQAELVPSEKASTLTDTVNIDFTGYMDGVAFEGGSAKSYDLVLGSNSFIPGFEEELVGLKEGETKSFNITFPDNYVPSLASKEAKFVVTINSIKSQVLPELDDEFAKSVEKYSVETLADLKEKVKEELVKQHAHEAEHEKLHQVMDTIITKTKFVIAAKYVEENANVITNQKLEQIKQYGLGKEEYLKLVNMTEEEFDGQSTEQALNDAKTFAVYNAVALKEEIKVEDDEVYSMFGGKEKVDELMAKSTNDKGQILNYISQIRFNLLNRKIEEYLVENN